MRTATYIACFATVLLSGRPPVKVPVHVRAWLFPGYFARRAAAKYGKRRNWTLVHLKPLP
jgi:hypothetical protein